MESRIILSVLFLFLFLAGCSSTPGTIGGDTPETPLDEPQGEPGLDWKSAALTDAVTGESFTISDFAGKTVLLESFAVWCPICLQQQKELAKLVDDHVVHVSLNTDPNEDLTKVKDHVSRHGFDWRFAVSPSDLTQELISEFGVGIVNAPSAPVIMVCPDQSTRLLGRGVKSVDKLRTEIAAGC